MLHHHNNHRIARLRVAVISFRLIIIAILLLLTPPDKARVTKTSPDDSDPLKLVDVNCTTNTIELIKRV